MTVDTAEVLRERLSDVFHGSNFHSLAQRVYRPEDFAGKEAEINAVRLVMGGDFRLDED